MRATATCLNYIFAIHWVRQIPLVQVPEFGIWMTITQCGLGLIAIMFGFAAWHRLMSAM